MRMGFIGGPTGNESACNAGDRRRGFRPWVRKIPWRRAQQPTPVFLPGDANGPRSLVDYIPLGLEESDTTDATKYAHTRASENTAFFTGMSMHMELRTPWDTSAQ